VKNLIIGLSTVANGNMYNRYDHQDQDVIKNREKFLKSLGIGLDRTSRVAVNFDGDNFCRYFEVSDQDAGAGMRSDDIKFADALITTKIGHALMLPVADCIAAVVFDPKNKVLMLGHLGRHSIEQQGALRSIEYLVNHYKSSQADIKVWLSPAVSKDNYPLWSMDNRGLKEVALEQFYEAGIKPSNLINNPIETDKDSNYYSFSEYQKGRRDQDGDHMVVAMMINS